ncbi:putative E3 ubiquitin-protein ligase RNF25-like [Apostichopus japonicus]|uniref:Putative E3 ubiquitin-protein ligase RNF25-like n=1 Tax=Stichopus japonicus TaxID=307972 RepID=A0A2G8JR08_STIJA|nr:putative E3 ubiquitin-protein ligase RNF25-like [Apostichopus japonicus]
MAASLSSDSTEKSIDGIFQQELELLQEIFIHEIEVKRKNGCPCELVVTLHPATADRADLQYVTLTLVIRIMKEYPDVLPEITIKNPRGLSEEEVANLQKQLQECASARLGEAMLYELIVMAKESLTANNTPSCPCVICCHNFVGTDVFTKTQCYHYFHNDCLARYIRYAQENEEPAVCPVCREPLSEADNQVSDAGRQTEEDASKFVVDSKLRAWQKKMAALKVKQAKRGGIIDVVANSNKYLLDISSTPSSSLLLSSISANLEENRETEQKGFQIDQKEGLVPKKEDPEKPRNSGGMEKNGRQGQDRPPSASRRGQTRDGRKFPAGRGNRIREEGRRGDGRYGRDQRPHSGKGQYERRNRGGTNSFNPQRGRGRNDSNDTTRGDRRDREREPRNNRLGTPGAKHAERGKREIEKEEEEEEEEEGFNFYGIKEESVSEKALDGERSVRREECGITDGHVGDTVLPSRLPSSSVAVDRDGHGEIGVKSEVDKTKPVVGVERDPRGDQRI